MMSLSFTESRALGILTLRGSLVEHPARELQTALAQALDQVNRLVVDCEQVTAVDSSRLHLLCTAYRVAGVFHKQFALTGVHSRAFVNAVKDTGYERCRDARAECEAGCLWTESDPRRNDRNDLPGSVQRAIDNQGGATCA